MATKQTDKLERIVDKISQIEVTLVKQQALFDKYSNQIDQIDILLKKTSEELKPLQKHVGHMELGFKIFSVLIAMSGVIVGALKIIM